MRRSREVAQPHHSSDLLVEGHRDQKDGDEAHELRPEAAQVVEHLRRGGYQVAMLTGDNETTARAIAKQIGMDRVMAEVMPEQKAREVERIQQRSGKVAFVGDGLATLVGEDEDFVGDRFGESPQP